MVRILKERSSHLACPPADYQKKEEERRATLEREHAELQMQLAEAQRLGNPADDLATRLQKLERELAARDHLDRVND